MATLWLKFPDEILLHGCFSGEKKQELEKIFSPADTASPWNKALAMIGLRPSPGQEELVRWRGDIPYFNWSCMVLTVSGGALHVARNDGGGHSLDFNIRKLPALLSAQWNITRFLRRPVDTGLVESIALGIVLQSLIMRLGSKAGHMAGWLASPASVPKQYKTIIRDIQAVQVRRTEMSYVWSGIFPPSEGKESVDDSLPASFWDDEHPVAESAVRKDDSSTRVWKGIPVCAGKLTGLAVAVTGRDDMNSLRGMKVLYNAPLILVFRNARPETTELFGIADAVLFSEGGVLSHACTVAREMNIPSATGFGPAFFSVVKDSEKIWLSLDGSSVTVEERQPHHEKSA